MAKKGPKKNKKPADKLIKSSLLRRTHQVSFLLNEKEKEAIESYCKKYKISNKSKFMRETLIGAVMEKFVSDYPTLFDKADMDKMTLSSKNFNPFI